MTRFQLVFLGGFPRPHQIPQRLVRSVGHPDRRQFSGAVATRQFLRIPPVRLDPVPGFGRHQAGRDHLTGHAQLRELPIQHVPGGASLVAGPQMLDWAELVNQFANRLQAVRDHAERADLSAFSATATAIVSAWTSRPTNSNLDMSDQFLSYAALRRWIHLFAA